MKKKIITSLLVLGITLSASVAVVEAASVTTWIKKAVFYVLKKGANNWYTVKASTSTSKYGATVTPGTLSFNQGNVGASVKFNVLSKSTKHSMSVYTTSSFTNWGKRVSLIVTNPKGNDTMNVSVNPGQYKGFKFGLTGTYVARFVVNDKWKLAPHVSYRYDDAYKTYGTRSLNPINLEPVVETVETPEYGELVVPEFNDEINTVDLNSEINMKQFMTLMTDDQGEYVMGIRDYDIQDELHFKDNINSIMYDSETNETSIYFDSKNDEDSYLKFSGDIRDSLNIGDSLQLTMSIVSLDDEEKIKVPSYGKYLLDNENKAPLLQDFLKK